MSLNIVIDADVSTATQNISKFVYTVKQNFQELEKVTRKAAGTTKSSTDQMGDSVKSFGKASQNSLTALSLTLQDLPFGFIGIQNNLPGIIQGLGQMSEQAKTGASVISQLKGALIGPAGIFLAFSAVSAIVTKLSMDYGGLGNAISVLTSRNKEATISQLEYNKALLKATIDTVDENAKINILVKTLTDLKAPLADRIASYNELKKIQPQILGGISEENSLNQKSAEIINNLAQQRKDYVRLRIQENAINAVLNKNASESLILEEKVLGAAKQLSATIERRNKLQDKSLTAREQETLNVLIEKEKAQTKTLKDLTKEYNILNGVTQSYLDKLDPVVIGIAKYDKATQDLSKSLKKQNKEREFYSNITGESNALGPVQAFSRYVIGQTNLQVKSIDKLIAARVKYRKETSKERATELVPTIISGEAKIIKNQKFLDTQAIAAEFALAKEVIDGVFFNPIAESFENFINTGKFTFDEFAKNIKANIAKIVAQIAASKIVELLGTIFAGPIAGGLSQGGGFLSAIGNILPAFRANTRFEGVRPLATGGGQKIDLVLRGTDLVGSINRTNAQISRVG